MPKKPAPPPPTYTPEQLASFQQKTQDWSDKLPADDTGTVEKKYVNEAIAKNSPPTMQDGTVLPCAKKIKNHNCVEPNNDTKGTFPASKGADINKADGTNVDWDQLGKYEGGEHVDGYVPWWPSLSRDKDGSIIPSTARVKNDDGTTRLHGANNSGVTVGTGVDLGQQDQAAFEQQLTAGKSPEEVKQMQPTLDKLKPYYGLKGAQACEALRNKPLHLTTDEAQEIDQNVQGQHLQNAMNGYARSTKGIKDAPDFTDLSQQEQTTILSREYQSGSVPSALAKGIGSGDQDAAVAALKNQREQPYLKGSYGP